MTLVMSEIVGQKGVCSLLNKMYERGDILQSLEVEGLLKEAEVSGDIFSQLRSSGLFMDSPNGFYISTTGKKITLLLKAINGDEEISEIFQQLINLYPSFRPYELITESVTDYFIDGLCLRPDFIRVLICSPWIRLDEEHLSDLKGAVSKAFTRYKNLQILIITKPKKDYHNWGASVETFEVLMDLGAEIVTQSKLHTKLYISEPGQYGGAHYAILGSENLTGRRNIELAIKIQDDNYILQKLHNYFNDIWQGSTMLKEVKI